VNKTNSNEVDEKFVDNRFGMFESVKGHERTRVED
jgi:hypothetical protein